MDCGLCSWNSPGKNTEWVAIPFSKGSSNPGIEFGGPILQADSLLSEPPANPLIIHTYFWKTQQWPQDWKRSVFIPIPKKGNAKECSNYRKIALISHSSKVMLKILQLVFNSTSIMKFQVLKLNFEMAEEREIKLPISVGSLKKQESSKKISTLLTMPKPLTVWITANCGNFLKRYQTTLPAS